MTDVRAAPVGADLAPRFFGQRVRRREDPRFLLGRGTYIVDAIPLTPERVLRLIRAGPRG